MLSASAKRKTKAKQGANALTMPVPQGQQDPRGFSIFGRKPKISADAWQVIGAGLRDLDSTVGSGNDLAYTTQSIQARRAEEQQAQQAQAQMLRDQKQQGKLMGKAGLTPQQAAMYQLTGKVPSSGGPQYFKSGNDIVSVSGDQANVIYDAPDQSQNQNLPDGMYINDAGQVELLPGYVDAQKALAGAGVNRGSNVQSTFTSQNGELMIVQRDGTIQGTGQFVRNPFQIMDVGGVPTAIDRNTGMGRAITTPEQVATNKSTIQTMTANEEDRRQVQKGLPDFQAKAQQSLDVIDGLLSHPGFNARYGLSSLGGVVPAIPESDAAGAQAYIDQVGGQAFLQAFESLKGGGQITEIEGQQATNAITRMTNQSIRPEEARKAAEEFKAIIQRGLERQQAMAQGSYAAQQPGAPNLQYDTDAGSFKDLSDDDLERAIRELEGVQ